MKPQKILNVAENCLFKRILYLFRKIYNREMNEARVYHDAFIVEEKYL